MRMVYRLADVELHNGLSKHNTAYNVSDAELLDRMTFS